ncbi:adapter protein CIKS isoform X2 [Oryzias latipes]|nr:adapter protein CIKS isoform X2 [Oryzias latipes]XP_020570561.1 adapter protein CIKS isoform X2 [Oryzias latipes]
MSIPVETDERMSPFSDEYGHPRMEDGGFNHDFSGTVSLEQPQSLRDPSVPPWYSPQKQGVVPTSHRQCTCCPPDHRQNIMRPPHENMPCDQFQRRKTGDGSSSQRVAPPIDVMRERSVSPCVLPGPGLVTGEVRRTISLPEESRKVFITYSMDTAKDIIPFTTFLINQGFKPECDIFDTPIRRMGITKWMDSFLNDKSVLIIVVISPKYKKDVEGGGDDEHSQHTKYIHSQIQNEYIQQGCLNFRLVPVLFPNATKADVPSWMKNTRIYRWPSDTQELVLRLLREERYIIPQPSTSIDVIIRSV